MVILFIKSVESATEMEKRDLMNELQIMVTVGEHPNVISLIGACTRSGKFSELNALSLKRIYFTQSKIRTV